MIDQIQKKRRERVHWYPYSAAEAVFRSAPGAGSPRPGCRLRPQRLEEVERRDLAIARAARSASATILRTRGVTRMPSHSRSSPVPSVRRTSACTSRTSMPSASSRSQDRRVALFEQGYQQMFGTDVVVAVVTALLFGDAKHAPRGRTKFREQACSAAPVCERNEVGGNWSGRLDSNQRPLRPERSALPS